MNETPPGPGARQHALELVLAPADDTAVRTLWDVLERAGVRSSARHRGPTHRPHVTVLSGPRPSDAVVELAAELWHDLLPTHLSTAGLVLLGGTRPALAELLVADPATVAARGQVQMLWPGVDARPWVPHLTLAPRLRPEELTSALAALQEGAARPPVRDGIPVRVASGLRWWDPDEGVVHELSPQPS